MTATLRRTGFHTLKVSDVQRLCDDAVAVTFDVPEDLADTFRFKPGQSLTLRREIDGRDERRSYSICAPAGAAPRVGVREVPGGLFSSWLVRDVKPGDEIEVAPPTGNFSPDLDVPGHHVLIAAGSGITPVLSIASSLLSDSDATVTVLYGNRRTDTVMFADDLADLKDRHPARLELVHVLSREPREAELFTGRLDVEKLRRLCTVLIPVEDVAHWWLCGPFEMVTGAQELLRSLDVADEKIHQELFYVDTPPEPVHHIDPAVVGASSEVTLVLDGRSTTMTLPRSSSLLDGAQKYRPDLPFACKGGVCGTCRAKICDGTVDMRRNFALEKAEVDAGFVLTCQSVPISDAVTVDFDA
ncbi:ring-1,2-phenylacetyl-CoA epoxidase subunit PaaE [Amycolatopsis lurida]|uniref:Phenylacetic acid degradation protein n=1 Tax=Amycolatopsis lurida NRRL 2430 TaxID=1460371 RepID=A0A2P2FGQ3_AMYLU|nr:1,2-phenylacetyl-CoA epoxidase subunit PaaE [Amycolatopsis lurida]KFU75906.1 phenylacetic acid degradation protein [Amycolatopsis lurida NRRL 2430]SED03984.1 ring-1,2-phenylacetyl-CoA epoxidase subunit PaaE [Amycolatopsis lurida]